MENNNLVVKAAMAAKYELNLSGARIHITKGNKKIGKGIYSISTLPGNEDHMLFAKGELLTSVSGTCSGNCCGCFKQCYARRSAVQHHNVVVKAWGDNTLLKRSNSSEYYEQINQYIKARNAKKQRVELFRWNVSGEVESVSDLEGMLYVAYENPSVMFSVYTKNYEALEAFLMEHSIVYESVKNLVINVSQWHGSADRFLSKFGDVVNVFEYDDSNLSDKDAAIDSSIKALFASDHCPAVRYDGTRNDITCDGCKRCYRRSGKTTKCYSH